MARREHPARRGKDPPRLRHAARPVETHAILRQLDRETDEHGRIVATPDDYLAVRELVADLMSDAVGATVRATVRQTVEAIRQLATPGGVTIKQLADHLRLERSAAQYRVQTARDGGFIVNIEDRRGLPAATSSTTATR
jgi:hypothetical protein